jgi:hypothetical protein
MKTYRGVGIYLHLALVGPGRIRPSERDPQYSLDRRLAGPQNLSEHYGENKYVTHAGNRTPVFQSMARHYTD